MRRLALLTTLLSLLLLVPDALATRVRLVSLDQMTKAAGTIVVARVEAITLESTPAAAPSTTYHLQVETALKGATPGPLDIRFFGTAGGRDGPPRMAIPGAPKLTEGEVAMLFLLPPSKAGFTSPVGLGQGYLPITAQEGAPPSVVVSKTLLSPTGAMDTLSPTQWAQLRASPVPLDTFVAVVEQLILVQGEAAP